MNSQISNLKTRPPIVVVMGHIDHGKTTLLDYIRKTEVAKGESGGITQHIGAYQANHNGKPITFIDTPGHEAFFKMRSRGAKIADIAILVVAADDGVKPQTKESILTIKEAKIPFVVAINKIDKESADLDRVKNELAGEEIFLEGRGGNIPFAEISAKNGQGVSNLIETVLLLSELEDLKGDMGKNAEGVIIESHLDAKRGITATVLIKEGVLKKNQFVSAGEAVAKIIILEDFNGGSVDNAGPSDPVLIVGFSSIPSVGLRLRAFSSQKEALLCAKESEKEISTPPPPEWADGGGKNLNSILEEKLPEVGVVVKSDTAGSAEAIVGEIQKLKRDFFNLKILRAEAGDVSDDDIKLASSSKNPIVMSFRVKVSLPTQDLADKMRVGIWNFSIIYDIYDFLKNKIEEILPPQSASKILGRAKVLRIFPPPAGGKGKNQIIGGKVIEGSLEKGSKFLILRRSNKIGEGKIENLQMGKVDAQVVETSREFGAKISSSVEIVPGDEIEVFKEEITKRKL